MRYAMMLSVIVAVLFFLPVAVAQDIPDFTKYDYTFGPSTIVSEMGMRYNESYSNDTREYMDTNDDWNVSAQEVTNWTDIQSGYMTAYPINWTIDGKMHSTGTVEIEYQNAVGAVNSTNRIVFLMTFTYPFDTSESAEHTILIPFEDGDGGDAPDIDVKFKTESDWTFKSLTGDGGKATLNAAKTVYTISAEDLGSITGDLTIVITSGTGNGGDGDDDDDDDDDNGFPGFEMIAVVGAMAVALIAFRRRR